MRLMWGWWSKCSMRFGSYRRIKRPQAVYGCEVWRDLDWMPDERKIVLDVSGRDNLAAGPGRSI
jgi:hypothetical protein